MTSSLISPWTPMRRSKSCEGRPITAQSRTLSKMKTCARKLSLRSSRLSQVMKYLKLSRLATMSVGLLSTALTMRSKTSSSRLKSSGRTISAGLRSRSTSETRQSACRRSSSECSDRRNCSFCSRLNPSLQRSVTRCVPLS